MYLKISDKHFIAKFQNQDTELIYENITNMPITTNMVHVTPYVCLFDNDWKIVEEVWQYLQSRIHAKRLKFNTIITKGTDLKLFYDFLTQYNMNYDSIKHKHINDFIAWLMKSKHNKDDKTQYLSIKSVRSAKTVNRIISTIRDFYKYLEVMNNIDNPFKHGFETIKRPTNQNKSFYAHTQQGLVEKSVFKIKEFDKGIRVLSKEQIETILNATTIERDKLLFELLLFTGMRIGEALSLDIHSIGISDISSNVQELKMNSNESDIAHGSKDRQQKTGIRDIFIPTLLMQKMSDYYEKTWLKIYEEKEMSHEYFFISEFHNNKGTPLSYQAVWDRCRKIGKLTGIYFTPHDFRHTYATILARNNIGIERLKKLLGHTHIASTDIYIQIANKDQIIEDLIPFYENYGVLDE